MTENISVSFDHFDVASKIFEKLLEVHSKAD
jgi:hypothetical protein